MRVECIFDADARYILTAVHNDAEVHFQSEQSSAETAARTEFHIAYDGSLRQLDSLRSRSIKCEQFVNIRKFKGQILVGREINATLAFNQVSESGDRHCHCVVGMDCTSSLVSSELFNNLRGYPCCLTSFH